MKAPLGLNAALAAVLPAGSAIALGRPVARSSSWTRHVVGAQRDVQAISVALAAITSSNVRPEVREAGSHSV